MLLPVCFWAFWCLLNVYWVLIVKNNPPSEMSNIFKMDCLLKLILQILEHDWVLLTGFPTVFFYLMSFLSASRRLQGDGCQRWQVGRSVRLVATCGWRGGQLPGPAGGQEADCPHASRVQLLAAWVLLQLAGGRTPVFSRHSNQEQRIGEHHCGPGSNTWDFPGCFHMFVVFFLFVLFTVPIWVCCVRLTEPATAGNPNAVHAGRDDYLKVRQ